MKVFTATLRERLRLTKVQMALASPGIFHDPAECRRFLDRINAVGTKVECPHNASHILQYMLDLLRLPKNLPGCIVEAGCFKGGSTAKVSIVAKMLNRPLVVFDSFEGLPDNAEEHRESILGHSIEGWFKSGQFCGRLEEVRNNVQAVGELEACRFVEGWFDQTMPSFSDPIAAAYIDVDLASSTKTCLKELYPRIVPGGLLYSQDGDFPLVIEIFKDDKFWETEVGCRRPVIEGLGTSKMLKIVKPGK